MLQRMPGKIAKTSGIATKRKETDKENRTSKVKKLVSAGKKTVPFDKKPVNSEKTSNENYDKVSKVQTSDKVKSKVLNGSLAETRTGKVFIGYHASSAGGVHNAITHSVNIGAECLALFLRPQRQWAAPPLKPEVVTQWKELVSTHNIQSHLILPHGSYLLNLGSPEEVDYIIFDSTKLNLFNARHKERRVLMSLWRNFKDVRSSVFFCTIFTQVLVVVKLAEKNVLPTSHRVLTQRTQGMLSNCLLFQLCRH